MDSGELREMVSKAKQVRDPSALYEVYKKQNNLFEMPDKVYFPRMFLLLNIYIYI